MNPISLIKILQKNPFYIKTTKAQTKQIHAQIIKHKLNYFSIYKQLIRLYTINGLFTECIYSFKHMRNLEYYPDKNILPSLIKSCTHLKKFNLSESLHGFIIRVGLDFDLYTCNALMNMYLKNLKIQSFGTKVFDESPERKNNCVFDGIFSEFGSGDKRVVKNLENVKFFENVKNLEHVKKVFENMVERDIVSWNTIINGFAQNGGFNEAIEMVRELGFSDIRLDSFTLSSVLPIFSENVDVLKGKEIHGYAIKHGFDSDVYVASGLIDMYANCTRVEDSCRLFRVLGRRDSVLWNALIAGCVQNGMFEEGLSLFRGMLLDNFAPMPVSFSSIIPACAHLTMVNLGKELHGYVIRGKLDDNVFIASALVDMYARFGNITEARYVFNQLKEYDMVSYTAMIMGCALHGDSHEAVSLFKKMEMEGLKPNAVAFLAVLTACSHAKLVDEGWVYFKNMTDMYGIMPSLDHYGSMVDLLGRAGKLEEAYEFISSMPIAPTTSVWSTLLAACRVHKNINLAERITENILSLDPENTGAYVLLSNTYSAAKMWKGAALLRMRMRDKGMRKNPACSWIEIKREVHAFVSGDKSHPCYDKIDEVLGALLDIMEKEGYVRNRNDVALKC